MKQQQACKAFWEQIRGVESVENVCLFVFFVYKSREGARLSSAGQTSEAENSRTFVPVTIWPGGLDCSDPEDFMSFVVWFGTNCCFVALINAESALSSWEHQWTYWYWKKPRTYTLVPRNSTWYLQITCLSCTRYLQCTHLVFIGYPSCTNMVITRCTPFLSFFIFY